MSTMRKYLTLRNVAPDLPTEIGIDDTIRHVLEQWRAHPLVTSVTLVFAFPVFRSDGVVFVTTIFDVEVEEP